MGQALYYTSPFLSVIIMMVLVIRVPFFQFKYFSKKWLVSLLAIKLVFGLFSWVIFQFYYGGVNVDIINYWNDSELIYEVSKINLLHFTELFIWNSASDIPTAF